MLPKFEIDGKSTQRVSLKLTADALILCDSPIDLNDIVYVNQDVCRRWKWLITVRYSDTVFTELRFESVDPTDQEGDVKRLVEAIYEQSMSVKKRRDPKFIQEYWLGHTKQVTYAKLTQTKLKMVVRSSDELKKNGSATKQQPYKMIEIDLTNIAPVYYNAHASEINDPSKFLVQLIPSPKHFCDSSSWKPDSYEFNFCKLRNSWQTGVPELVRSEQKLAESCSEDIFKAVSSAKEEKYGDNYPLSAIKAIDHFRAKVHTSTKEPESCCLYLYPNYLVAQPGCSKIEFVVHLSQVDNIQAIGDGKFKLFFRPDDSTTKSCRNREEIVFDVSVPRREASQKQRQEWITAISDAVTNTKGCRDDRFVMKPSSCRAF